jgi:hypothetical protein
MLDLKGSVATIMMNVAVGRRTCATSGLRARPLDDYILAWRAVRSVKVKGCLMISDRIY